MTTATTLPRSSSFPPPPPALGKKPLRCMVEAGGIDDSGQATAAGDMDSAMADCGGGGTGAGRKMAEADGKGLLMLAHIMTEKK
jgi:hypothetical protein